MMTYVVKSGDSLSKIAQQFYGTYAPINGWSPVGALQTANGIANANLISVGQTLVIPDKPAATAVTNSANTPVVNSGSSSAASSQSSQASVQQQAQPKPSTSSGGLSIWWYVFGAAVFAGGAAVAIKKYKEHKLKKATAKK